MQITAKKLSVVAGLLFLIFSASLQAQTRMIEGKVVNKESGEVLIGATIQIRTLNGKAPNQQFFATSNEKGTFTLEVPMLADSARYDLECRYLGFTTQFISLNLSKPTTTLQIELNPTNQLLTDVVISANRQSQERVRSGLSIVKVEPYLFKNRVTLKMEEALDQMPGVQVIDGQVNIRSGSGWSYGTGSRVSVLVDGMPLMDGGTGQVLWNFLPIENIQNMEVLKGAAGVLFGSSALNGVINISTKWPGNEEIISFAQFQGFYDLAPNPTWRWEGNKRRTRNGAHFLYGNGKDRKQFTISGNYLRDDSYRMGDQDHRGRLSFNTRMFSKNQRWRYGINGNMLAGKTASFLLWQNYDLAYTALDSAFSINTSSRFNLDPYLHYIGEKWSHFIQNRVLAIDNRLDPGSGNPDQSNQNRYFYHEYRTVFNGLKKQGFTITSGWVLALNQTQALMFQGTKSSSNQALFFQTDYQKGRLNLSGGMRWEAYQLEEYQESKPVFRGSATYKITSSTFVRASFGQGFRFPTVAETFIQTNAGPVQIVPNKNLRSESGYNAEIGVFQAIRLGGWQGLLDLAFYRMGYDNMMEFTFGQWGLSFQEIGFKSVNIGRVQIDGIDASLSAKKSWKKQELKLLAGYNFSNPISLEPEKPFATDQNRPLTYKNTSSDTTGKWLKYRNRHQVKLDLEWENEYLILGSSYRYFSRIEAIDQIFNLFIPGVDRAMQNNQNGVHLIDCRASYKIDQDWKVTFTISNLFNQEYMTRPGDMRPPRAFLLQFSYNY